MTFTVGSYSLTVSEFSESAEPVSSEWLRYEEGKIVKHVFTYGILRLWSLRCIEANVAWSSSAAKYLQEKMESGEKVTFSIDEGSMHQVSSVQVYVRDVEISYSRGSKSTQFKREFRVTLQEASSQ